MKSEEEIRKKYRSYIELFASLSPQERMSQSKKDIYGAILAYGFVLEFSVQKVNKDIHMALNKYL